MASAREVILSRLRILTATMWRFDMKIASGGALESKAFGISTLYNDSATAAESLCVALKTLMDSHANAAIFTVTFSRVTGKFTIASDGATFDLLWVTGTYGTSLRDWLGFTADKIGANTYTSDAVAQGVLFPESGREDWPDVEYEGSGKATVGDTGVMATIGPGTELEHSGWSHPFEYKVAQSSPLASGVLDRANAVVPWVHKDFWNHHCVSPIGRGEPFRYYLDTAAAIGGYEDEYVMHESMYGGFKKKRIDDGFDVAWRVTYMVRKYVTAT